MANYDNIPEYFSLKKKFFESVFQHNFNNYFTKDGVAGLLENYGLEAKPRYINNIISLCETNEWLRGETVFMPTMKFLGMDINTLEKLSTRSSDQYYWFKVAKAIKEIELKDYFTIQQLNENGFKARGSYFMLDKILNEFKDNNWLVEEKIYHPQEKFFFDNQVYKRTQKLVLPSDDFVSKK